MSGEVWKVVCRCKWGRAVFSFLGSLFFAFFWCSHQAFIQKLWVFPLNWEAGWYHKYFSTFLYSFPFLKFRLKIYLLEFLLGASWCSAVYCLSLLSGCLLTEVVHLCLHLFLEFGSLAKWLPFDFDRYIEYMCDMMAEEPIIPHSKPILVRSIIMTPVPLFSKQRNGCRPFCEVYVGDERVTTTSQEYDKMK